MKFTISQKQMQMKVGALFAGNKENLFAVKIAQKHFI